MQLAGAGGTERRQLARVRATLRHFWAEKDAQEHFLDVAMRDAAPLCAEEGALCQCSGEGRRCSARSKCSAARVPVPAPPCFIDLASLIVIFRLPSEDHGAYIRDVAGAEPSPQVTVMKMISDRNGAACVLISPPPPFALQLPLLLRTLEAKGETVRAAARCRRPGSPVWIELRTRCADGARFAPRFFPSPRSSCPPTTEVGSTRSSFR